MKRFINVIFVYMILFCAYLTSCDNSEFVSWGNEDSSITNMIRVQLDVCKQDFEQKDSCKTRSSENNWHDNDTILLRFHTDNGIVIGKATYHSSYGDWEVAYNGVLNREKESRVEVSFFDNAPCNEKDVVMLTSKYGAYQDKEGRYLYADGVIKISALLKPLTSRIMFKGSKYTNIKVIGLKSLQSYDLSEDKFIETNVIIKTSTEDGDNTGYLYVKKDEATNNFSILYSEDYDYFFSSIYTSQMLNIGKSGWMNIPTTTKHNGWTMQQVSGEDKNGHMWVDLGLPSGTKWADENIGASMADYQESRDISDLVGDFFRWGADKNKESYCTGNKDIQGNASYDMALRSLSGNWLLPSKADFEELITECKWNWVDWYNDGKSLGFEVTGPNGECIFFPCPYTHSMLYWTSTPQSYESAWTLALYPTGYKKIEGWLKNGALEVRAIIK